MHFMIAGVVVGLIGWVISEIWSDAEPESIFWVVATLIAIGIILPVVGMYVELRATTAETTYYLEAEVLACSDNETVFTSDQGYYTTGGVYPDDLPYLLTMLTNCTSDTADDEIAVVWTTADREKPALG